MTTLHWIKGVDREYKQFVQNRVKEIRQLIPSESWNHCPGYENPADLPSREMSAEALQESEIWWHGPPWLLRGKDKWPSPADVTELSRDYYDEMRPSDKPKSKLIHSTGLVVESRIPSLSSVLDPNKFGDFKRLIRVTAFVLRFLRNTRSKETQEKLVGPLSNEECESVEILWLKEMQKAVVRSPRFENLKQQLGLYSDDNGLLRCRGRLQNASIPFDAKHPILLPVDHHLTVLIIDDCHQRVLHNGVKETLTELRSRFWVTRGRQTVRKVISKCVNCKKTEGKHYAVPPTAPLPQFRVEENPAFTNTEIDFAGPLFVRSGENEEQSNMQKVYLALFTCGSTRAVHLEVVPNLSTETFIRSFNILFVDAVFRGWLYQTTLKLSRPPQEYCLQCLSFQKYRGIC